MAVVRPAADSFDSNMTASSEQDLRVLFSFLRGWVGLVEDQHTHSPLKSYSTPTHENRATQEGMIIHCKHTRTHKHTHTHTLTLPGVSSRPGKGHGDSHTEAAHTGALTAVMTDPLAASSAETQAQYHSEQACNMNIMSTLLFTRCPQCQQ